MFLLWKVAIPEDPYPLSPEEQKRLSEVKFDFLKNEVKINKTGYNIRFLPWFFTIFGVALLSKLIEWTVSGFTKITWDCALPELFALFLFRYIGRNNLNLFMVVSLCTCATVKLFSVTGWFLQVEFLPCFEAVLIKSFLLMSLLRSQQ